MKDIKLKHGKTNFSINRAWASKFKSTDDFVKAMDGKLTNIPEPKRTEMLREEHSKLHTPAAVAEKKK